MVRSAVWNRVLLGGMVGVAAGAGQFAAAAVGDPQLAEATAGPTEVVAGAADLEMRFVQEGGPEAGHVRVLLTPELRPLTVLEARAAAQQAFLKTLTEPALGDGLSRVTVVVHLMPKGHPDAGGAETVFLFISKGGKDWTVMSGD